MNVITAMMEATGGTLERWIEPVGACWTFSIGHEAWSHVGTLDDLEAFIVRDLLDNYSRRPFEHRSTPSRGVVDGGMDGNPGDSASS